MNGNIPVIHVCERTLPEALEQTILKVWENGMEVKTQYDQEGVPNSKDATATVTIEEPFAEPRIYKNFPGGPRELEFYRQEVLNGIHDHWIDPAAGKWTYCVSPDTDILMKNYNHKKIKDCQKGDEIISFDFTNDKTKIVKIKKVVTSKNKTIKLKLSSKEITVSPNHPLYVKDKGWIMSKDIHKGDNIACIFNKDIESINYNFSSNDTIVTEEMIMNINKNINKLKIIKELKDKKLLPFKPSNKKAKYIILLMGYLFGDRWLASLTEKKTSAYLSGRVMFGGEYSALLKIQSIIKKIGYSTGNVISNYQNTNYKGRNIKGVSLSLSSSYNSLWTLFYLLGVPVGSKTKQKTSIPGWIKKNTDKEVIRCFLDGFVDAEMSFPYKKLNTKGIGALVYFRQNKDIKIENNLNNLINDFQNLFTKLNINMNKMMHLYTENKKYISASCGLRCAKDKEIKSFLTNINYPLSYSKQYKANLYEKYMKYCDELKKINNVKNMSNIKNIKTFEEYTGQNFKKLFYEEIIDIEKNNKKELLYDIVLTDEHHNFIGNGIINHNTYHQRLFSYVPGTEIDQIEFIISSLCDCYYSRRSQATTYYPPFDSGTKDPPCLQRIWCRLIESDSGELFLNMNTHWRSRDLFKAWFMNVYALTELQKFIANEVSKRIGGPPVAVGRYVDICDSLHIYGVDFKDAEAEIKAS